MMNWILLLMAGVIALGIAIFLGGLMIPAQSSTKRNVQLNVSADQAIDALTDADRISKITNRSPTLPTIQIAKVEPPSSVKYSVYNDSNAIIGEWLAIIEGNENSNATLVLHESMRTGNPMVRFVNQFRNRAARIEMFIDALNAELASTKLSQ